ncbi:MAG: MFS transporter [Gammaproteobacteria bacterium]|nr:MAG: MFS transporter [Gammaproteobacteria bacterium]
MATKFVLADSPRVRYATGSMMYFAQGIPAGLLHIALPAWLASQGVGAGQIASFMAVIVLPWAFKLLSGPLMDHYEFLPMGRRRPWVLGAQLGLTLSFFALMLVERPAEQIGLLMLIGVFINIFAATQDVAVDGMSIDLTPVEEQGRLNASMAFGKAVGWGVSSAVSGVLLVTFGLGVTAIVAAMVTAFVLLLFIQVLEREGERRLPWSDGKPALEPRAGKSLAGVFKGLNKVLWTRVSLILMLVMVFDGLVSGYGHALMPIAAIKLFGFTTPQWSNLVAVMGLAGAAVALGLGPLIDRFGAKRMLFLTILLVALHAFLLAKTQTLWQDTLYVKVMLSVWILLGPVTMVCMIALAMTICSSVNSATQFAIYMSLANLGSSAGAKIYGMVAEQTSYTEAYITLGLLTLALLGALSFHRHRHAGGSNRAQQTAPTYTVGMSTSGAGMYMSGAMRCPKCRSDMDEVEVGDAVIDRCSTCHGLWFDVGELERLRRKEVAAAIDIGDPAKGKVQNTNDRYGCPRCGGQMVRMVDPRQKHIWYEECGACHGSYFDAGEFTDLTTRSLSDIFKRFTTPERE